MMVGVSNVLDMASSQKTRHGGGCVSGAGRRVRRAFALCPVRLKRCIGLRRGFRVEGSVCARPYGGDRSGSLETGGAVSRPSSLP